MEKGLVISTSPEAGSQIKKGNTVILYISTGREIKPVTVINFVGMTEEKAMTEAEKLGLVVGASENAARKLLESYGFQVEVQWENGEKVDNAVVKSYSPNGSAESGSTVTIVLGTASQGPGTSDHTDGMGN